jgi:hypothetical protein
MNKTLSLIITTALCASLPALAESDSEKTAYFGPLGLTTTSSARLNVLAEDNIQVELLFADSSGKVVADSGAVSLAAGRSTSLTLVGTTLIYPPGALRAQVQGRVRVLSAPGHSPAFASLELLDPGATVLVLYPTSPVRALATNTLILGPLAVSSSTPAGIAVSNLSGLNFPNGPCKAVLSFYSDTEAATLLKQEVVTIEPGQTATLSMSGLDFSGEIIGTVSFDSSAALTVSSLQVFDATTGTTRVALYPSSPVFPTSPVFPASPVFPTNPIVPQP